VLGATPVALLFASSAHAIVYGSALRPWGLGLVALGLLVGIANVALTFRPAVHRWKRGSMTGYRNVSGLPILGTLLVVVGGVLGFGSLACGVLGLVTLAIDTNGLIWFLVATWRDASFWDS
jgi:hypothetical protein